MVHPVVDTGQVPSRPPTAIESLVRPVCDPHAQVVDWELAASPTAANSDHGAAVSTFHHWRATFTIERILCERALARAFIGWAPAHLDVGVLEFLSRPAAVLGPVALLRSSGRSTTCWPPVPTSSTCSRTAIRACRSAHGPFAGCSHL
jgi:hypothetical protein